MLGYRAYSYKNYQRLAKQILFDAARLARHRKLADSRKVAAPGKTKAPYPTPLAEPSNTRLTILTYSIAVAFIKSEDKKTA